MARLETSQLSGGKDMKDKYTKIILTAIACGLFANVLTSRLGINDAHATLTKNEPIVVSHARTGSFIYIDHRGLFLCSSTAGAYAFAELLCSAPFEVKAGKQKQIKGVLKN